MGNVEQVVAATREVLGADIAVDHIDDQLLEGYEASLRDGTAEKVEVPKAGSSPEARTNVQFGNHPAVLGGDFMFTTNGVGQPCGTGFSGHATGWESVRQEQVENCSGRFPGYKFTFTYRR